MEYKQTMTLIRILLVSLVLFGCKKMSNEYDFSNKVDDWCVIVNRCYGGNSFFVEGPRRFVFPESGILTVDIKDFDITNGDVFLINGNTFDPNSKVNDHYKLCYHTISKNVGYGNEEFDYYFFYVGKDCSKRKPRTMEEFFIYVNNYLKENKVKQALN